MILRSPRIPLSLNELQFEFMPFCFRSYGHLHIWCRQPVLMREAVLLRYNPFYVILDSMYLVLELLIELFCVICSSRYFYGGLLPYQQKLWISMEYFLIPYHTNPWDWHGRAWEPVFVYTFGFRLCYPKRVTKTWQIVKDCKNRLLIINKWRKRNTSN